MKGLHLAPCHLIKATVAELQQDVSTKDSLIGGLCRRTWIDLDRPHE